MDNQNQDWGGVNYADSALTRLGSLAKRLATALERSAINPETAWSASCVDLAIEIEKTRNPSRYAFDDQRRRLAGTCGFDRLAAIEEVYAAHDELLRINGWESVAENHDERGTERLCANVTVIPEIITRLRDAAEVIDQTQAGVAEHPWSKPMPKPDAAKELGISPKSIDRWSKDADTPYEFRECGKGWWQYRVRSR